MTQQHHYYASSAFGWAAAPTRREAVAAVARDAGSAIVRRQVKAHGGLYVWSCRVELPQSATYTINEYAPEFITAKQDDGTFKSTNVRVPTSRHVESRVVDTKGHAALED